MPGKGAATRARILIEAKGLFHRKGFSATTVNDLLAATGTTKGNLYFHFSGKDQVALEVLQEASEEFLQFLDEALTGETPGAALENFFRQALEKNRCRRFVGGCLFGNTALEASDTQPELAAVVSKLFAAWIDRLRQTLAAAQDAGQVRADLSAAQLAELVVAALEGGIMQSRLNKQEGPLARTLETLRRLLGLKV